MVVVDSRWGLGDWSDLALLGAFDACGGLQELPEPEHYLGQVFLAEIEKKKNPTQNEWPDLQLQQRE